MAVRVRRRIGASRKIIRRLPRIEIISVPSIVSMTTPVSIKPSMVIIVRVIIIVGVVVVGVASRVSATETHPVHASSISHSHSHSHSKSCWVWLNSSSGI